MRWLTLYFSAFRGLSREIWFLALVTFINRAGTMVIPFLSLYLKNDQHFSYGDIGWIMTAFGIGSLLGSWLGGKMVKKVGFYKLMVFSLFSSGLLFILIQYVSGFWPIVFSVLTLMVFADCYRPAAYLAIQAYSEEENKTRSLSLFRLAINLGFSFGPALGGYLIASFGFASLFWVDGITCVLAGMAFLLLLKERQAATHESKDDFEKVSPYRDPPYLLFSVCVFIVGFCFLQYFSSIPLYYKEIEHQSEQSIGFLFFLNGFLIFLIEMPIVKWIESRNINLKWVIVCSMLLIGSSFLILTLFHGFFILITGMFLVTIGEILNFPFMNAIAMKRGAGKNMGDYMALYTMAFSLAHIMGHNSGMQFVKWFGYTTTWLLMFGLLLLCIAIFAYNFKFVTGKKK